MIKLIVTDIDGVLTDGKIYIANGMELQKTISLKDMDAIAEIRKQQIAFGVITGEKNGFTEYLKQKIDTDFYYEACKEKKKRLEELSDYLKINPEEICYVGDGKYDVEAIGYAGLGICPADAIIEVKEAADYILTASGGNGCLAECLTFIQKYNLGDSDEKNIIDKSLSEHIKVFKALRYKNELRTNIETAVSEICDTFEKNGQLLLCGNGGSAADAQHIATELVSRFYFDRQALNAEALTVNASSLTAIGNDYSFERVFARQVEAKGKKGDVLIGISTSGNSNNVVEAMKTAKELGMKTIAFIGGDNQCIMAPLADIVILVPSFDTPRVQEMHIMIGHIICECVEQKLFT